MAFLVLPCIGVVDDATKSFLPELQEVLNLYRSTIPRERVRYLFYATRSSPIPILYPPVASSIGT